MARILVVEDELPMRTALADSLGDDGHRVVMAADGEAGLEMALAEKPDLILLDVMMPKMDGYAVCAELRRLEVRAPILMLTAKGQTDDLVAGLDSGADDYLTKPFSNAELMARVRALLRRVERTSTEVTELTLGNVVVDFEKQTIAKEGRPLELTGKEFAMLRMFAEHRGEPITRDQFLDVVWGYAAFPTTRTVDNHVSSLRAKIEDDASKPKWIVTVHRVGYKLNLDQPLMDADGR